MGSMWVGIINLILSAFTEYPLHSNHNASFRAYSKEKKPSLCSLILYNLVYLVSRGRGRGYVTGRHFFNFTTPLPHTNTQ